MILKNLRISFALTADELDAPRDELVEYLASVIHDEAQRGLDDYTWAEKRQSMRSFKDREEDTDGS